MNSVSLIGRLTKDIDLRYTSNGKAVANGTLAVERYSKGEKKTDFVPFVIWDKSAEVLAKFTKKGSQVGLKGSIQTRTYDDKEGKKVFVVEVLVDGYGGLDLLDSKGTNDSANQQSNSYSKPPENKDPFDRPSNQPIDISSDDLPF